MKARTTLLVAALLATGLTAAAEIAAVSSKVFNGYTRARNPDGTVAPETYTFGDGGIFRATTAGNTVDSTPFLKVAHTLSPALRKQGYVPSGDPNQTTLLLMVGRGTTTGSEALRRNPTYENLAIALADMASTRGDPTAEMAAVQRNDSYMMALQMDNEMRDYLDRRNSRILGFEKEILDAQHLSFTMFGRELLEEIQENRYFVVVSAYDFQLAWKEKKMKLLWETRFSIREHGNDFPQQLSSMAHTAGQFFGESTRGLVRRPLREGNIEIGETKVLDDDVRD